MNEHVDARALTYYRDFINKKMESPSTGLPPDPHEHRVGSSTSAGISQGATR